MTMLRNLRLPDNTVLRVDGIILPATNATNHDLLWTELSDTDRLYWQTIATRAGIEIDR